METKQISKGDIVTVDFKNLVSSNTFIVEEAREEQALLTHPLFPGVLVRYPLESLNKVGARLKDSTERNLDFARRNERDLGYKEIADLEALCLYFVVRRRLTDNQKNILARINGVIASIRFNNSIEEAMRFVVSNNGAFDDFNRMWYNNFSNIFTGRQPITSKKQRATIFNMAGFLLAELENPQTEKQ